MNYSVVGRIAGPACFGLILLFCHPAGLTSEARCVLATTAWIAVWWVTEAIPIAATALLPIVLFPLTGAVTLQATTAQYGHRYIFLYVGGFLLAIAIERWNLHRRIASEHHQAHRYECDDDHPWIHARDRRVVHVDL